MGCLVADVGAPAARRRATDDGVEATYAAAGETERELRALPRLGADRCSSAEWRVSRRGEELVLHVTSHGDRAAVRGLFMPFPPKRPAGRGTR